ncbi:MAG TPA: glycosyltransferase family 4 protein [Halanaerobiales bacterium]|nr:glycosyltransferase family 4 protein [Halanaerobiales bacterium]
MKILMFSWEYPPLSHGGLARHVQDLSEALVKQGHQIYVISRGDGKLPSRETVKGVNIIRTTPVSVTANNFVDNILHLNFLLIEKALEIRDEITDIDLVHGHDWSVFWASRVIKHSMVKPLIFTIHATEFGRNQGIYNNMQRYINDLEWYATFEAWKVIVCSQYMCSEVMNLFQLPEDKVIVVSNGVDEEKYRTESSSSFRNQYASPDEKIVFYVGRIVREKGIQVLIHSVPEILKAHPNTKFVISGKGSFLDQLREQASYLGIAERIYFTGFVDDETRNKLYRVADVAVFPSLYEPFGIVALEAMVTRTPVLVSNVGGLAEFVNDGENGLTVEPNNPGQLAEKLLYLFNNPKKARRIIANGYRLVKENFSWNEIARKTVRVYEKVLHDYQESDWKEKLKARKSLINEEEDQIYQYSSQRKYS